MNDRVAKNRIVARIDRHRAAISAIGNRLAVASPRFVSITGLAIGSISRDAVSAFILLAGGTKRTQPAVIAKALGIANQLEE